MSITFVVSPVGVTKTVLGFFLGLQETRINIKISDIYRVDLEEAKDIHINYHSGRIFFLLSARAKKNGMTDSMFIDRVKNMNIYECALSVAQGELIEMAAVDLLYEELCEQESKGTRQDRYNSFYG